MRRHGLLLGAWGMCVLGLLVRVFAGGLVGGQRPAGFAMVPHRVDLNRAGVPELTVLPGIGRGRAEAIVVERIRSGHFRCSSDLQRVDGLGPAITDAFRDMVTFEPLPSASSSR